jgi:hypothetical protein
MVDMSDINNGRNTTPKKLSVSKGYDILYNDGTLDYVFSNQIQKQTVFIQEKENLLARGIDVGDKLVKGTDSNQLPIYSDSVNSYTYNSFGYRSPEFGSAKLLYAGCSNTFGTGIPEEAIWGTVLANKLNLPYANLSKQGASAQWIVKNIFAYFEEYGHPDVLCCLFPDPYRISIATNETLLVDVHPDARKKELKSQQWSFSKIFEAHLFTSIPPKKAIEYSKKPHKMIDVIPADAAVYASIQSILTLDQYCRAVGIKFVWSTWDVGFVDFLQKIKTMYPKNYSNLLDSDIYCWVYNPDEEVGGEVFVGEEFKTNYQGDLPAKDCHPDLLDKYGVNFYRGMDILDGVYNAHPGVHQHAHIAESFLKALSN